MLPLELESVSPVLFPALLAVSVCTIVGVVVVLMAYVSVDVNAGVVVCGVVVGVGIVNGLHPSEINM